MKRTYAKSSDSFPGRVDSSNCKLNSVVINVLLRVSSKFSAILSTLRWTELSLRRNRFYDLFRRFVQDCFNNLFNCRQNQFFSNSVGLASFRYQQRNVVRSLQTVIWIFWWGSKHIHCFLFKNWSRREWKNASVLPDLSGWIFWICLRSLDGFIASLEKFFSRKPSTWVVVDWSVIV